MKDIILDVDTGIDDALAIILACQLRDELDLLGITTVAGNVGLSDVVENTRTVLGLAGRSDVPVSVGAASPLVRPLRTAPAFHGKRGLGDVDVATLKTPRASVVGLSAAEFIAAAARERPGRITVVATGPLTNLALALKMDQTLVGNLSELVIMGGAVDVPGNASPVAEANFFTDPEAAQIVLSAGVPITLVPLDVTEQVTVSAHQFERIRTSVAGAGRSAAAVACDSLDYYLKAYAAYGRDGAALHDPLAVLLGARPELAEAAPIAIDVATSDPITAGACVVDRRPNAAKRPAPVANLRSCRRVQVEQCRAVILDTIFASGGFHAS